jgi:hypothetical protein
MHQRSAAGIETAADHGAVNFGISIKGDWAVWRIDQREDGSRSVDIYTRCNRVVDRQIPGGSIVIDGPI